MIRTTTKYCILVITVIVMSTFAVHFTHGQGDTYVPNGEEEFQPQPMIPPKSSLIDEKTRAEIDNIDLQAYVHDLYIEWHSPGKNHTAEEFMSYALQLFGYSTLCLTDPKYSMEFMNCEDVNEKTRVELENIDLQDYVHDLFIEWHTPGKNHTAEEFMSYTNQLFGLSNLCRSDPKFSMRFMNCEGVKHFMGEMIVEIEALPSRQFQ